MFHSSNVGNPLQNVYTSPSFLNSNFSDGRNISQVMKGMKEISVFEEIASVEYPKIFSIYLMNGSKGSKMKDKLWLKNLINNGDFETSKLTSEKKKKKLVERILLRLSTCMSDPGHPFRKFLETFNNFIKERIVSDLKNNRQVLSDVLRSTDFVVDTMIESFHLLGRGYIVPKNNFPVKEMKNHILLSITSTCGKEMINRLRLDQEQRTSSPRIFRYLLQRFLTLDRINSHFLKENNKMTKLEDVKNPFQKTSLQLSKITSSFGINDLIEVLRDTTTSLFADLDEVGITKFGEDELSIFMMYVTLNTESKDIFAILDLIKLFEKEFCFVSSDNDENEEEKEETEGEGEEEPKITTTTPEDDKKKKKNSETWRLFLNARDQVMKYMNESELKDEESEQPEEEQQQQSEEIMKTKIINLETKIEKMKKSQKKKLSKEKREYIKKLRSFQKGISDNRDEQKKLKYYNLSAKEIDQVMDGKETLEKNLRLASEKIIRYRRVVKKMKEESKSTIEKEEDEKRNIRSLWEQETKKNRILRDEIQKLKEESVDNEMEIEILKQQQQQTQTQPQFINEEDIDTENNDSDTSENQIKVNEMLMLEVDDEDLDDLFVQLDDNNKPSSLPIIPSTSKTLKPPSNNNNSNKRRSLMSTLRLNRRISFGTHKNNKNKKKSNNNNNNNKKKTVVAHFMENNDQDNKEKTVIEVELNQQREDFVNSYNAIHGMIIESANIIPDEENKEFIGFLKKEYYDRTFGHEEKMRNLKIVCEAFSIVSSAGRDLEKMMERYKNLVKIFEDATIVEPFHMIYSLWFTFDFGEKFSRIKNEIKQKIGEVKEVELIDYDNTLKLKQQQEEESEGEHNMNEFYKNMSKEMKELFDKSINKVRKIEKQVNEEMDDIVEVTKFIDDVKTLISNLDECLDLSKFIKYPENNNNNDNNIDFIRGPKFTLKSRMKLKEGINVFLKEKVYKFVESGNFSIIGDFLRKGASLSLLSGLTSFELVCQSKSIDVVSILDQQLTRKKERAYHGKINKDEDPSWKSFLQLLRVLFALGGEEEIKKYYLLLKEIIDNDFSIHIDEDSNGVAHYLSFFGNIEFIQTMRNDDTINFKQDIIQQKNKHNYFPWHFIDETIQFELVGIDPIIRHFSKFCKTFLRRCDFEEIFRKELVDGENHQEGILKEDLLKLEQTIMKKLLGVDPRDFLVEKVFSDMKDKFDGSVIRSNVESLKNLFFDPNQKTTHEDHMNREDETNNTNNKTLNVGFMDPLTRRRWGYGMEFTLLSNKKKINRFRRSFFGKFENGERNGEGEECEYYNSKTVPSFKGNYLNGMRHGKGVLYKFEKGNDTNTIAFEGVFENGMKNGKGEAYNKELGVVERGTWENDVLDKNKTVESFSCPTIWYKKISKYLTEPNLIGKGAFGLIYKVESSRIMPFLPQGDQEKHSKNLEILKKNRHVAVKVIRSGSNLERNLTLLAIKRGIKLCSRVESKYILKMIGLVTGNKHCGCVMELGGLSIDKLFLKKDRNISSSGISMKEKLRYLSQTAEGLRAMHEKDIMHRDMKWTNVILDVDGENMKITDFDTLKEDQRKWKLEIHPQTSQIGTTGFIPPEVFDGKKYTLEGDVYAFGMMIFSLLWEVAIPQSTNKRCTCGILMENILTSNLLDHHVSKCGLRPAMDPESINSKPRFLIDIMTMCWDTDLYKRPSFNEITQIFDHYEKLDGKDDLLCYRVITMKFPSHKEIRDQKRIFLLPLSFEKIAQWLKEKITSMEIPWFTTSTEIVSLIHTPDEKKDTRVRRVFKNGDDVLASIVMENESTANLEFEVVLSIDGPVRDEEQREYQSPPMVKDVEQEINNDQSEDERSDSSSEEEDDEEEEEGEEGDEKKKEIDAFLNEVGDFLKNT